MPKSPEEMEAAMVANMPEKTGKPIEAWLKLARASGLEKHGQITKHMKTEHGMTHGYASLVSRLLLRESGPAAPVGDALVDTQYAGAKAGLRPIYDAIIAAVGGFGDGLEIAPKKAYVSLRRSKQFALVQPSTKTRMDVGIKLNGVAPDGRLEDSGKWNDMVTHRVRVTDSSQVDDELIGWLRAAFDAA